MREYFRPIVSFDAARPADACPVAGGPGWFAQAERISRDGDRAIVSVDDVPDVVRDAISAPRASIAGLDFDTPVLMGILNVTPDSFSDGGQFNAPDAALARALDLAQKGADIVDIGGESTRPGADFVPVDEECARTIPVIAAVRSGSGVPISIDTRKAQVGRAALEAGANVVNDVSALTFEPELAEVTAQANAPVCLMHAQGDPTTMQQNPIYDDVLLDVYDFLSDRIDAAVAKGVARDQIIVDPGIGFGKTLAHNLALLRGISLFHGLGCPILLGVSRKKFIGTIANVPSAEDRAPGSIATALAALSQGVQLIRTHDVSETQQAVALWQALHHNIEDTE
ncbi:dihydropteroate synthase [Aliiroseovarius sp. YM-037]|uniref:dihydropteroate synthase n=1 Tax=Aliiroseovarius sp. YM-037 TaxID=3341728 RepID=UPI003A80411E